MTDLNYIASFVSIFTGLFLVAGFAKIVHSGGLKDSDATVMLALITVFSIAALLV